MEAAVGGGTKVAEKEFEVSTELLMRELLKLDGIEAEGEAKMQRKAEVCIYYKGMLICSLHCVILCICYMWSTYLVACH